MGLVLLITWLKMKLLFCEPDAKAPGAEVLLQTSRAEDWVTVWGPAPHWKETVSPTEALVEKGIYRRTP